MLRAHGCGGAAFRGMDNHGRKNTSPRQLLLHYSKKLHSCRDAFSTFPTSILVIRVLDTQ